MKTLSFCIICLVGVTLIAQETPPRSLDDRLEITLFAEDPLLNTPTGIDVDHKGRVWVIESNTHFPPEGYKGHPTDRLLILEDSDGDGKAEAKVFIDGFTHTMSVAVKPVWLDPILYDSEKLPGDIGLPTQVFLATRNEILLLEDTDGDDKCDKQTRLVHLETKGNYPHNGLAGFAFDGLGNMYFGFGENLGADYKIIGRDGTTYSGGGEGGNIYQVQPDGTKLKHWATGFWNPHANCVDAFGNLFSVDNDPDSLPPCRLLHIIEGGDYGYRYRNGRTGFHPFTCWNGEIPGTLPMVAGTGEAPSGILAYEHDAFPEEYLGNLIVTSWGDHRIDRFNVEPEKATTTFDVDDLLGEEWGINQSKPYATLRAVAQPFIVGSENFRPVGIALAPDGSLYVSDWVLRDYKLHGKGRVWRIFVKSDEHKPAVDVTKITTELPFQQLEKHLFSKYLNERRMAAKVSAEKHIDAGTQWARPQLNRTKAGGHEYSDRRSRVHQEWSNAWEYPLSRQNEEEIRRRWKNRPWEEQIRRWREYSHDPDTPFKSALARVDGFITTEDITVERFAEEIRNPKADSFGDIPEELSQEQTRRGDLRKEALRISDLRREELRINATLMIRKHFPNDRTIPTLAFETNSAKLKRLAVQWIAEERLSDLRPQVEALFNDPNLTPDLFMATLAALEMLDGKPPAEFDKTPPGKHVLPILRDDTKPANVRAIALRLVDPLDPELDQNLVRKLTESDDPLLRREAIRTAAMNPRGTDYCGLLKSVNDESLDVNLRAEALVGMARRMEDSTHARGVIKQFAKGDNPVLAREALRALREKTDERPVEPSAANAESSEQAGRRLFFHPNGPGCFKCHTVEGRGGKIGPDLTTIGAASSREKLIESIRKPSQEVAPQFTTWAMISTEGKSYTGMIVHENKGDTVLGLKDGTTIDLKTEQVEERIPQKTSIMPDKLEQQMTEREFEDLLAFLQSLK